MSYDSMICRTKYYRNLVFCTTYKSVSVCYICTGDKDNKVNTKIFS
jgi:hypothetical protein